MKTRTVGQQADKSSSGRFLTQMNKRTFLTYSISKSSKNFLPMNYSTPLLTQVEKGLDIWREKTFCHVAKLSGTEEESISLDEFFEILNHPLRRRIIILLNERIELSYSTMLNELGIDQGQFNFHLRKLKNLVTTKDGTYLLSPKGRLAHKILMDAEKGVSLATTDLTQTFLSMDIVLRRLAAFLLDVLILFIATGLFLDENVWSIAWHLGQIHVIDVRLHAYELVTHYSHIFFAAYIIFTMLDIYKGQSPGKYIMSIRVVKENGRKLDLVESSIRNIGKVFLLPIDLPVGLILYARRGYIKFFDYYTRSIVERTQLEVQST